MSDRIPSGIRESHVVRAISDYESGEPHDFAESTGYDLLYRGRRYPPKAILGLAAFYVIGHSLKPSDFKGGLHSKCFRILAGLGFSIVAKGDRHLFPDELSDTSHLEGAKQRVFVNRYERDTSAREACISHYGYTCSVCRHRLEEHYGSLAKCFIHVHHLVS